MEKEIQYEAITVGEILCPGIHPFPRNTVELKEGEGVGSKMRIQCGMCGHRFEGEVIRIREKIATGTS